MRGVPEDRRVLGPPAGVPRVRQDRLLRRLPEPPRDRALPRDGSPDRALGRARRGVELVLPRRGGVRGELPGRALRPVAQQSGLVQRREPRKPRITTTRALAL